MQTPPRPLPRAFIAAVLLTLTAYLLPAAAPRADAQEQPPLQQPLAVLAVAGLDPLLEDIDHLFAAGEAPQHARQVREVIAALHELRGLDRQRPLGAYLFFPVASEKDPQPLLFFPVADIAQLQTSLQIEGELQLLPGETDDRLTLRTKDGDLPVRVQHGFAFVDPTKTGSRLALPLPDPMELIAEQMSGQDGILLLRREGLPPATIELALGQIRAGALTLEPQREGEKDAEFALRSGVHSAIFSLLESAVQEWRGATLRWGLSGEDRSARIEAAVRFDRDGRTLPFLRSLRGDSRRFSAQRGGESAVCLSLNWQPTPAGRELLESLVASLREQMRNDLAAADAVLQEAALGFVDALEATVTEETFDSYLSLHKHPQGNFVLLGATAVADSDKLALGFERLLPFAADSADVRRVEMSVARAGDVAIHRLWPQKLRKRDRRLYGEDAAIYLAAGRGALWIAVGGDGAASQLADTIVLDKATDEPLEAGPRSLRGGAAAAPTGPTLLDLSVAAGDWIDQAGTGAGGADARVAEQARRAFEAADDDRLRLWLQPDEDAVRGHLHLEHGYIRLLGLSLADRLSRK
jgi:hypothetical protein